VWKKSHTKSDKSHQYATIFDVIETKATGNMQRFVVHMPFQFHVLQYSWNIP